MILNKADFYKQYLASGDEKFPYMLLYRMRLDCDYYIAYEKNCPPEYNHLWAHNDPEAQIAYMRYLWEFVPEKPEWLSMEDIDELERRMSA